MRTRLVPCVCLLVVACLSGASAFAFVEYTITDLGTLGGDYSYANAINDAGQVTGQATTSPDFFGSYVFLWESGAMTNLGELYDSHTHGLDINDDGVVVGGGLMDTYYGSYWRAYVCEDGVMTPIGTLGGDESIAHAINNEGWVVGRSLPPDNSNWHAFLWEDGVMTDLGTFGGGWSEARGINDSGWIVGGAFDPATSSLCPCVWLPDGGGGFLDLGGMPSPWRAEDVNNHGQIVGIAGNYAFLWQDGVTTDLGVLGLGARPYAINDHGQVVGSSEYVPGYVHAFVWQDGAMCDLNDLLVNGSGWDLEVAHDINNAGRIVGVGYNPQGEYHGFLLTPIPEPSTVGLFVLSVIAVALKRRR